MYNIGDYVIYKRDGVCRVTDIARLSISSAEKGCLYYHLKPEKYDGKIYIPVNEDTGIRPMITRANAQQLLDSLDSIPARVCRTRDKKALQEHYDELLRPNTCEAMMQTMKSIYAKHATASGLGRLNSFEEQVLKRAEQALCEELSLALDMPENAVRKTLASRLICTSVP